MKELIKQLESVKLTIFDLDGVVYRGNEMIPNSDNVIQTLKDMGIKVVYNSNNSTTSRDMYVKRLTNMGIPSEYHDFYTSASITALEITKIKKNANIYVIGDIGLREELKAQGHSIITAESKFNEVDFVIVGLDIKLTYKKIRIAQKCILRGNAEFYATNPDTTLPMPDGLWPGAGVMVNAIETCTGRKPVKTFGKPEPYGIKATLRDLKIKPDEACIFGDRLDTDILAGNRANIITVMVLTGVTTKTEIDKLMEDPNKYGNLNKKLIPDLTINSLEDIFIN
ncbi:MAG: HAD-IIA family hydrolase [Candidatus Lokiarchaeota archaeon]|nr:HAD-IIA family hydrolase [Candidatus Lokiarchaeota archaeon]